MSAGLLITVVDDDQASRQAISGLIRSMGHDVAEFASGAEFLTSQELERTGFLIADQRMPGMSGIDLYRRLLSKGFAIPTAIVTAYPSDAARSQALRAGAMSVLVKPLSANEVAACLDSLPPR